MHANRSLRRGGNDSTNRWHALGSAAWFEKAVLALATAIAAHDRLRLNLGEHGPDLQPGAMAPAAVLSLIARVLEDRRPPLIGRLCLALPSPQS